VPEPDRPRDDEAGRDQQQGERRKVGGVDAVGRGELDQHVALAERLDDHDRDRHRDQQEGLKPSAAGAHRSRHLLDGNQHGGRRHSMAPSGQYPAQGIRRS